MNGKRNKSVSEYKLKKGENIIKIIIKKKLTNLSCIFYRCKYLIDIIGLKYLDVTEVKDFGSMFAYLESLSDILQNWNGSNGSLSDIKPLQNWNVSNGTTFSHIFNVFSSLSDIKPLQNWNVSNGTNFEYMLSSSSLSDIKLLQNWNVSNSAN